MKLSLIMFRTPKKWVLQSCFRLGFEAILSKLNHLKKNINHTTNFNMKKILLSSLFLFLSIKTFSQYQKVYRFDDYQKNWALVKTKSGTFGFIDKNKKAVVAPIYSKIEKFGIIHPDFALVKSIADTYGLINREGKEVTPAIYEKIGKFGDFKKGFAVVESTTNHFGLIDENGKESVPPNYSLEELKMKSQ